MEAHPVFVYIYLFLADQWQLNRYRCAFAFLAVDRDTVAVSVADLDSLVDIADADMGSVQIVEIV